MRLAALALFLALAAVAPALASPTACAILRTGDVERAVGRVTMVKGGPLADCGGTCDGGTRSYCSFRIDGGGITDVTVLLSLPPYRAAEDAWRATMRAALAAHHTLGIRDVPDLGDAAFWTFHDRQGDLAVFRAGLYHLIIQTNGSSSEDVSDKVAEALGRCALQRL
ncbi:MAG TPA: hypothetical protein VMH86_00280 [Rhizomicrobium sp.]|nr:hypothetical protein [Rhizomicrobium sp.]